MGQGADSMLATITAEELGVDLAAIRVVTGDTDLAPVDLGGYSSRTTMMAGNACLRVAREVGAGIREVVAASWECPVGRVALAGGFAIDRQDTARKIPLAAAFQLAEAKRGTLGGVGHYNTPKDVHGGYRGGTIGASPAYSFTAHVAEVAVDVDTGIVRVEHIWAAHDVGRAINPMLVEGQIEGSVYMGMAEALFEEHVFHDDGLHRGPSLLAYKLPTTLDTPELSSFIVESNDPEGPYGAKEAGEGPLHPSIPAIANAIYDAVGVRLDRLPFSPARVLAALRANREER
jgi:CO/xanthine dehydrogenase Mo-binding subunit